MKNKEFTAIIYVLRIKKGGGVLPKISKRKPLKRSTKAAKTRAENIKKDKFKYEIIGILLILSAVLFSISLFVLNNGIIGDIFANTLLGMFGLGAYFFPLLLIFPGLAFLIGKDKVSMNVRFGGYILAFINFCISLHIFAKEALLLDVTGVMDFLKTSWTLGIENVGGGILGGLFGGMFLKAFGFAGSVTLIVFLFVIAFMMISKISIGSLIHGINDFFARKKELSIKVKNDIAKSKITDETARGRELLRNLKHIDPNEKVDISHKKNKIVSFVKEFGDNLFHNTERPDALLDKSKSIEELTGRNKLVGNIADFVTPSFIIERSESGDIDIDKNVINFRDKKLKRAASLAMANDDNDDDDETVVPLNLPHGVETTGPEGKYCLPPLSLLNKSAKNNGMSTMAEVEKTVLILQETLNNFGVSASVEGFSIGPSITRFEVQLAPGVKVSKITSLADDIALSLACPGIRIAPIAGKTAIGIEVPNKSTASVFLRDMFESGEFQAAKSKLSIALGKDVAGANIIGDLSKMPHLLIAGSTGSGKSVCMNTLIASILFKATPDEVKLIMIDPKVVELSIYKEIPHLLVPVVTDPKKAAGALNWAVQEMSERYKLFAAASVRDITGYNGLEREEHIKLPHIVVLIDELADLMMVAPGDVEDAICRLAQMARAAGIHLVIATQRPSVDVITGLIKANVPSRISFAVSSSIDSRTILDEGGAEKLLGKGDMLYYPVGFPKPLRVQGAFISEKEIEKLVNFVKKQVKPEYNEDILKELDDNIEIVEDEDTDVLLKDAIDMIVDSGQASITLLQRRLRIGYNRAARLIDQLEERKIIGGFEGSKPRKVLVTREQLDEWSHGDEL